MASAPSTPERAANPERGPRNTRRYHRQRVQNLAYFNLDQGNGGIIRDVCEGGCAVRAVSALQAGQQVSLRLELVNPRTRFDASARVAWCDASGQAGLEFLGLPPRFRAQVKEWIFTQLLAAAQQASGADSIFIHQRLGEEARELLFSADARPAILLPENAPVAEPSPPKTRTESWFALSARTLAGLVDSLILLASVLLFGVVALVMTNLFPTWLFALGLAVGVTTIFGAVYWFFFVAWIGKTPGERLARWACLEPDDPAAAEEQPRFR